MKLPQIIQDAELLYKLRNPIAEPLEDLTKLLARGFHFHTLSSFLLAHIEPILKMQFFTAFLLLSQLLIPAVLAGNNLPLEVETSSGTIEGFNPHKSLRAFLGIPYAQPPVGDLRFKPPQALPSANSSSVIDATKFGNSCMQFRYKIITADKIGPATGESEDCLTINIWGPAKESPELLPSMVWLYGGGFGEGASSDRSRFKFFGIYDGVTSDKLWQYMIPRNSSRRIKM